MLYEFHHAQNSKKPGSVYATYLIDGVPHIMKEPNDNGHPHDGEDISMQSSPYMSSSMPQEENDEDKISLRKVILAKEEDLEGNKRTQHIMSLHDVHCQRFR